MSASGQLLIHIGYHKTGSTWLQQHLFPVEGTGFQLPWSRLDVNERIVVPKPLVFDPEETAAFFRKGLEEARAAASIPVISNERLSGNPHSGGYDSKLLADRLYQLFPTARVLIVIREQRAAIRSAYVQYVREGGVSALRHYLEPPRSGRFRIPLFDFDFYCYHRLVGYYQTLFGRERVLVLPFETLRESPERFAAQICEFAGARAASELRRERTYVGLSGLSAVVMRRLNRLFVRDTVNPDPLLPWAGAETWLPRLMARLDRLLPGPLRHSFDRRLAAAVEELVGDRFCESNRITAQLTGLALEAHGYRAAVDVARDVRGGGH